MFATLRKLPLLMTLLPLLLVPYSAASEDHAEFNLNWRFHHGHSKEFSQVEFDDSGWRTVSIPHDWSIEDRGDSQSPFTDDAPGAYDTGYTTGGIGWYRKTLTGIEPDYRHILIFGGVYMNSSIFVNGIEVATHYYGYTGFQVDISAHLQPNKQNIIAVKVHNNEKNSRWYSGSGIFRPVQLIKKHRTHIKVWGTKVVTRKVQNKSAELQISTSLTLDGTLKHPVVLENEVLLAGKRQAFEQIPVTDQANTLPVVSTLTVNNAVLWEPENPQMYQLVQRLKQGDTIIDQQTVPFGLRTVELSETEGLLLNGMPITLRGMNIHHDNYSLGAAAHPQAEARKVKTIIAAGYNAVRSAHNPPSSAFLRAADKHGLLVISEAFDSWNQHKWDNINDYSAVFKQDWRADLRRFIQRDVNHPSIIMWSVGNEIPEQESVLGARTAKQLVEQVKALDNSRPVTIGTNTSGESAAQFIANFDVVGYNYQPHNYVNDYEAGRARFMYGSETYSKEAFDYWQLVEEYPYVIGDFVWTGWDYMGEASIGWTGYAPEWAGLADYPWTLAYTGEIDVLGNMRPAAYYRQVLWNTGQYTVSAFVEAPHPSLSPTPDPQWYDYWTYPDIHPNWTWPEQQGKPVNVTVYSVYPQVELLVNDRSYGTLPTSKQQQYTAQFKVPYQPGELLARGLNSDGEVMATWRLLSSSRPATTTITPEQNSLQANGTDILYLDIRLVDAKGREVYHWDYDQALTVNVSGAATLIALGNGNPRSAASFKQSQRKTFRGKLQAIIQSNGELGDIRVVVSGKGLKTQRLFLVTTPGKLHN